MVWSRDAATGGTQLKPIEQTFEKHSATLVLTFSNGETVETTREHPFYVVGRGFVAAGELGIGTSIVTRAGPTVQVASSVAGEAQTVYNFEVADYHTYFVGQSALWVHNDCGKIPGGTSIAKDFEVFYTPPHPKSPDPATDFDEILKVGGKYWFIQDKLNSSGSAANVAKNLRESLSKYEEALNAHFAGQLTDLPPGADLSGLSITDLKFGARIGHPNASDPNFQAEILRQVSAWEGRHPNMGKIVIEFIPT